MTPSISPSLVHACFRPTYASARAAFLLAADTARARTDTLVNDVARAPDGSTLTTDVAILGPDDADQALLIVSGTHGPEGFSGSAAQIALLNQVAFSRKAPAIRMVLVHAINPWGFAHISRTTENNVDLNRNFIDWNAAPPENPLYAELHAALHIESWTAQALARADEGLEKWMAQHGQDTFVDVVAKGQYTHPDGIHYGGQGREWSNRALESIVARHLSKARRIGLIDWHTGLGERGQPFFLCFNERGGTAWDRACGWWGRDNIETKAGFDGSARPNYSGLLFQGVQRFARQAEVTGAVIEFGTKSSAEMRRALQTDGYLRFGVELPAGQRDAMREDVLDAFAPLSMNWKRSVLSHAMTIQEQAIQGVSAWK